MAKAADDGTEDGATAAASVGAGDRLGTRDPPDPTPGDSADAQGETAGCGTGGPHTVLSATS
jgi:hypothetical protein